MMQEPDNFRTDTEYLWGVFREEAKEHHRIIAGFLNRKLTGRILDIGERNPLTEILENSNGVQIDNTKGDLDEKLTLPHFWFYDTIICSHVIEHLFNPLDMLCNVKMIMRPTAKLYIVTPIKPYWITPARCHFHEMDEYRFRKLIKRAGLKIVDWQKYSVPVPLRFGIRNLLRRFYKEYSIVTLMK